MRPAASLELESESVAALLEEVFEVSERPPDSCDGADCCWPGNLSEAVLLVVPASDTSSVDAPSFDVSFADVADEPDVPESSSDVSVELNALGVSEPLPASLPGSLDCPSGAWLVLQRVVKFAEGTFIRRKRRGRRRRAERWIGGQIVEAKERHLLGLTFAGAGVISAAD